ncbi:MAG: hypothetical protein AAF745_03755, partial [Planctomycetota bacterium]
MSAMSDVEATGELMPTVVNKLHAFSGRRGRLQLIRGLAFAWIMLIVGMLVIASIDHVVSWSTAWRSIASLIAYVGALIVGWICGGRDGFKHLRQRDLSVAARGLESCSDHLKNRILAAVELAHPEAANGSAEFRSRLQSAVSYDMASTDIRRLLPWSMVRRVVWSALLILLVVSASMTLPMLQMPQRLARAFFPLAPIPRASITHVTWLDPSPRDRLVAEGDLVAVRVAVRRLGNGTVALQARDEAGDDLTIPMTRRDQTDDDSIIFAANLQVDATPVMYRVLAGDAETTWATLEPKQRPRIASFDKHIRFPTYSKLPDRIESSEDGNLIALAGSDADVTVHFDQPVKDAMIRYADDIDGVPLRAVEGDGRTWTWTVPIRTPATYRIDAVSIESGLSNPFTSRHAIEPVDDQPPRVVWTEEVASMQIASPVAALPLSAVAMDDLPIDLVIQEIMRDGEEAAEIVHPISPSDREVAVDLSWDLTQIHQVSSRAPSVQVTGSGTEEVRLPRGTRLRTRLVAVDRLGNRGASPWIDVLVSGNEFDTRRHESLWSRQRFVHDITQWWEDIRVAIEQISQNDAEGVAADESMSVDQLEDLWTRWERISEIETIDGGAQTDAIGLANSIGDLLRQGQGGLAIDPWLALDDRATAVWQAIHHHVESKPTLATFNAKQLDQDARSAITFVRSLLAIDTAVSLRRDLETIRLAMVALSEPSSNIPVIRLPGQSELIVQQLQEVSDLL